MNFNININNINIKKNQKKNAPLDAAYIVRNIVTALAVINLFLLFGLHYNVPGFAQLNARIESKRDHIDGITESEFNADSNVLFDYENDVLTYDGKGDFDATADVTIKDAEGNELTKDCLTAKVTGDADKEIEYSYKSEDGSYYGTDTRTLKLTDYEGPSIKLEGDIPTLTDDNLVDVAELTREHFTAKDGFGNDISDDVTILAGPTEDYDGIFLISLSVTNIFGDTAKAEQKVVTNFERPHLKLTQAEASVKQGEDFDPKTYILYAVDWDGGNLMDQVEIDSDVDTETVGDYTVKYDLTNKLDQDVNTKELTVHVVG